MGSTIDNNFGIQIIIHFELFDLLSTCILMAIIYKVSIVVFGKRELCSFKLDEAKIGIGNGSITFKYDNKIQEIAYKIWVELSTRKIGIMFDAENDVIAEVYDSWYSAFGIIRNLLKEIPSNRQKDAGGLVDITIKVLNTGLREHLTKWQARFRKWYESEKDKYPDLAPQEIQKKYPKYTELVEDIKERNKIVIKYMKEIEMLAKDR